MRNRPRSSLSVYKIDLSRFLSLARCGIGVPLWRPKMQAYTHTCGGAPAQPSERTSSRARLRPTSPQPDPSGAAATREESDRRTESHEIDPHSPPPPPPPPPNHRERSIHGSQLQTRKTDVEREPGSTTATSFRAVGCTRFAAATVDLEVSDERERAR
jgi:hypothetical protein